MKVNRIIYSFDTPVSVMTPDGIFRIFLAGAIFYLFFSMTHLSKHRGVPILACKCLEYKLKILITTSFQYLIGSDLTQKIILTFQDAEPTQGHDRKTSNRPL